MTAAAPRGELAASAGLLFTAVAWGTMVPLTSVLLEDLPPFAIAASRYTLALAVLACIIAARERTPILPLGLPWGRILLLGGGGIGCFATCYTFGIAYSGPIAAAAILATQPVIAVLMDWLVTRRRIGGRLAIAVALAVSGGLLVAFGGSDGRASAAHGGEVLLVFALFCWTWYSMKGAGLAGAAGHRPAPDHPGLLRRCGTGALADLCRDGRPRAAAFAGRPSRRQPSGDAAVARRRTHRHRHLHLELWHRAPGHHRGQPVPQSLASLRRFARHGAGGEAKLGGTRRWGDRPGRRDLSPARHCAAPAAALNHIREVFATRAMLL
jgi:hypothetical protein